MLFRVPQVRVVKDFAAVTRSKRVFLRWVALPVLAILLAGTLACAQAAPPPPGSAAVNRLADRAARGVPPANPQQEIRLADAYLAGRGESKDAARAVFWYRKAAEAGDPAAQNNLGYLYLTGTGVNRDEAEAAQWFARSLASGSQEGKFNLALIYLKSTGQLRDVSLAISLLNQLAGKDNTRAEDVLGVMYLTGDGVRQDPVAAEKWFLRSAKHGDAHGQYAIGALNSIEPGHEHNLGKAAEYLRRSAHGGYVRAMYVLGFVLVNHPEIPQKYPNEAMDVLTRAAEAGQWEASALLGVLARDGRGMNADLPAAFRWFVIEAKQGGSAAEASARQDLTHCRQALSSDQQDRELRAAELWLARHSNSEVLVYKDGLTISEAGSYAAPNGDKRQ
jgi:hypothetical protein